MEAVVTNTRAERRRSWRRARPEEHGIVSARVRPGHDVSVVNVSAGGALVDCGHRLLPGASVELHLRSELQTAVVRGRVVRCAVARLRSNVVCYRGAIAFDRHLPWFDDQESAGYAVPGPEPRSGFTSRAGATQDVV